MREGFEAPSDDVLENSEDAKKISEADLEFIDPTADDANFVPLKDLPKHLKKLEDEAGRD